MKEATGELSSTVITVVAIAAILSLFTVVLYPQLKRLIVARTYCQGAVNCTGCTGGEKTQQCYYYADDEYTELKGPITCDCHETSE